jgi:hypothetical protein
VISYDNFRAVLGSPALRGQYGLDLSPVSLATIVADEGTAQSFFNDWSRDGQPRLTPLPLDNSAAQFATQFAAPLVAPAAPGAATYAAAPTSTYAPMANASAPQQMPYPTQAGPVAANSGLRNILIGFGIALVGTIITVGTYNAGGTFVVAWGAILFGSVQGIRGIIQLLSR